MKVKFVPQNVEFEIEPGKSVMHVAQDNGLYIKSVCKGVPSCAECRVRVVEGDHHVLPPGSEELSLIGSGHFIDHRRLSCQLRCFGDITVDMTEQIAKEQGLIVGRKQKNLLKDDRVEEAVARRSESPVDEESSEDANADAAHQRPVHASRDPRDARESRETRDTRPRGERGGGERGGRGPGGQQARGEKRGGSQGGAPRGDRNQQNNRGRQQQGGGDRSPRGARPPVAGQSPEQAAQAPSPGAQPQQQRPSNQPRPERQPRAEGGAESPREAGEGGANKRRRRRRGKGGGAGGEGRGPSTGGGSGGGPNAGRSRGPSGASGGGPSRPGGGGGAPGTGGAS